MTIEGEIKTASEVEAWMDHELHKDGKYDEYDFPNPKKVEQTDNDYPNWNFDVQNLLRKSGQSFKPVAPEADREFNRIWYKASILFDME